MELFEIINFDKAYRKNRMNAAQWVLKNPDIFSELLVFAFKNDKEISHKANWVLEFVCLENIALLYPHLDFFFEKLSSVKADSSVRPLSHICEILCLLYYKEKEPTIRDSFKEKHKELLVECAFDWLITNQKVACEVRAMTCLFYLGTERDWIHPELKTIIEANIHHKSAGYKSRGKHILEKIKKS